MSSSLRRPSAPRPAAPLAADLASSRDCRSANLLHYVDRLSIPHFDGIATCQYSTEENRRNGRRGSARHLTLFRSPYHTRPAERPDQRGRSLRRPGARRPELCIDEHRARGFVRGDHRRSSALRAAAVPQAIASHRTPSAEAGDDARQPPAFGARMCCPDIGAATVGECQ